MHKVTFQEFEFGQWKTHVRIAISVEYDATLRPTCLILHVENPANREQVLTEYREPVRNVRIEPAV